MKVMIGILVLIATVIVICLRKREQMRNAIINKDSNLFWKMLKQYRRLSKGRINQYFLLSVASGNMEAFNEFIGLGANVNAPDVNGWPPIVTLTLAKNIKAVSMLLEKGADINARNSKGKTAYQYALAKGYTEIAELLKSKGAVET